MGENRIAGLGLNPGLFNAKALSYVSLTYRVLGRDKQYILRMVMTHDQRKNPPEVNIVPRGNGSSHPERSLARETLKISSLHK